MSDDTSITSRRAVLKRASVAAAIGVAGATGTAASVDTEDHCDCYHEYRCDTDLLCQDPTGEYWYMQQSRECCDCEGDGDYDCSSWTNDDTCCRA